MKKFKRYMEAEEWLTGEIINHPDFVTKTTSEIIGTGFILTNPMDNRNGHSNYEYAEEFFQWMLSGQTQMSDRLRELNPWAERFTAKTGLPKNFSSSYGAKIKAQMSIMLKEIGRDWETRRAYINILNPADQVILTAKTTHEFPCTVGLHLLIRDERLCLVTQMRSNNVYKVMPYDVFNFTMFQCHVAGILHREVGWYYHQVSSAHIYKGDIRRIQEENLKKLSENEGTGKIQGNKGNG